MLLVRREKYRVIHAFQASQAAGGVWLYRLFNQDPPFILSIQEGKDLNRQRLLTRFFRHKILKSATVITVISSYLADYARRINPQARIEIIPNGVDIERFQPGSRAQSRQRLGWADTDRIIMSVSRLVEKNGLIDLVKAFSVLNNKEAKLVLIGSGPLESELKRLANDLKISDSVLFVGAVPYDKVHEYLAAADIFARPSYSEGLGTAFLEAMACGLPVIGTSVGGIPDFLTDGETGLTCRVADPQNLAEKLNILLDDPALRKLLSENGRRLVQEQYTWQRAAEKFRKLYAEIS